MTPFIQKQLDILVSISTIRSGPLNDFFKFLNFFDTAYFIFILVPIIWVGLSWRWGIRLFYLVLLSAFINYVLKNIFDELRPIAFLPDLPLVQVQERFGFPSGGAQSSALLGGLLMYAFRSKTAIIIGIFYALLIGFSRLYLGVHFPVDVLAGYTVGIIVFLLFIYAHKPLEAAITRRPYFSLSMSILIPAVIMYFYPHRIVLMNMSAFLSGSIGIFFSLFYGLYLQHSKKLWHILLRSFTSIAGIFVVFSIMQYFLQNSSLDRSIIMIEALVMGIWISLVISPILKLLIPDSRWMNSKEHF